MAEPAPPPSPGARFERMGWPLRLSVTLRILLVNLLPLVMLGGGIFYLDTYRKQLLNERYRLARIEAQITAEALAGATRQRQEALLLQIGKEQRIRLRMYDAEGRLWADSFELAEPVFALDVIGDETMGEELARMLDHAINWVAGADPIPDYVEPQEPTAEGWPELQRARELGLTQIQLRDAPDGTPVINAAAPVGLNGATLLTTRNAVDITESVRSARSTLGAFVGLALLLSILLSLFLARTIVEPLRQLVRAAVRVRLGRDREVEVPRLPARGDEIGLLARAVSDMSSALRGRIDEVERFAADVAHEIKNPLASLRSALESLGRVEDPALRSQLAEIANHDVRRIDRLVTEISDASRVDAEMSRATFERMDLAGMVGHILEARESRCENDGRRIRFGRRGATTVFGVPLRLERVIENLIDNAVSFSPPDGTIDLDIAGDNGRVSLTICDQGPGIPADHRERIFERFHSVRPEGEGFGDHSGLGLAIARTVAEAHDGTLRVADRPEGVPGACFVLELPAA
jgi:two-component system sensor histidine kinase ChvG